MDQLHEEYDDKLLFLHYVQVPYLNDKGLQFRLTLDDEW